MSQGNRSGTAGEELSDFNALCDAVCSEVGPPPGAIVRSGYMGNDTEWCYWDAEYPDEGSCGPYSTRLEAIEAAEEAGYLVADDGALDAEPRPQRRGR
jgi:hypothetical protein